MQSYEKLGAFYMGRLYDAATRSTRDELLLYDAKDLTTHAVCVGMTGSGKTGLCLSLLEEAAIDGIPAIAIDPKGDLGNLLLTFPELRPADFRPWIDEGEAARKGRTPDEHAAAVAERWRKGLADWNQDGARIALFREAVDLAIYTPGSGAGLPLKLLRSFNVPPAAILDDGDALREHIMAAASGLLTLLGVDADPIQSREQILLSTLLQRAWTEGRDLDISTLIREIQSPPFDKIGVMDIESFFPGKDRFALSMRLNSLLASPGFANWMEGEPLDIQKLLWTPEGKPRIAILSIAHLSDAERMFFVTTLLNEVVAWMRRQPGTPSLRALLYMDEVFGYFPPTANPPSKRPMLTLLKQARAHGLGVVLATQNPVDLDYKGLSNAGTWFLGRLQTERDKARVLEGLEGASATAGTSFDRGKMEATLAGLDSRVFLMNNVHDSEPALFHTRWALSYLRGPLTRSQIQRLSRERAATAPATGDSATVAATKAGRPTSRPRRPASSGPEAVGITDGLPVLPATIEQFYLPADGAAAEGGGLLYRPSLLGSAQLHFVKTTHDLDEWSQIAVLAPLRDGETRDVWQNAEYMQGDQPNLLRSGHEGSRFSELPAAATRPKNYAQWSKRLTSALYRERTLQLWKCKPLKTSSKPGETEGEFRTRVHQLAREKRDLQLAKLEKRFSPKLARLQERIRKAEERVGREQSQYGQQKLQTAISIGATMLGAMFGRKVASASTVGRATTAVRGAGRASREKADIARAQRDLETHRQKLIELEQEFETDTAALRESVDPTQLKIESVAVRPRKSDIMVERVALVWAPWRVASDGTSEPAFTIEP